jgi:hypothetical protein
MRRPRIANTYLGLILGAWVALSGCHGPPARDGSQHQMTTIGEEKALELGVKALKDMGRDVDRYDVTVTEQADEWKVAFVGKPPRPPGDEVDVYVSKRSGQVRVMLGE